MRDDILIFFIHFVFVSKTNSQMSYNWLEIKLSEGPGYERTDITVDIKQINSNDYLKDAMR